MRSELESGTRFSVREMGEEGVALSAIEDESRTERLEYSTVHCNLL